MNEEPQTPAEKARYIAARIEAAMRDFERLYPPLPRFSERFGEPSRMGQHRGTQKIQTYKYVTQTNVETGKDKKQLVVGRVVTVPVSVPACEADWTLNGPWQEECSFVLALAVDQYVRGAATLEDVKGVYQVFADAHLRYFWNGREYDKELEGRLAASLTHA